jgi:hypothetical protein
MESVTRRAIADPDKASSPRRNGRRKTRRGGDPRGISLGLHCCLPYLREALTTNCNLQVDGQEGRRSLAAVLSIYQAAGLL